MLSSVVTQVTALQLPIAVILATFAPMPALTYALFHRRFLRLNGALNQQTEDQVRVIERREARPIRAHLLRLGRHEVRLSDTEAILQGAIFIMQLGLILFNLRYAATTLAITVGTIFSIISYSWEFVESALALPVTLQSWSRLS